MYNNGGRVSPEYLADIKQEYADYQYINSISAKFAQTNRTV